MKQRRISIVVIVLALSFLIIAAGCTVRMYPGPQRSKDKVGGLYAFHIGIAVVDGERVDLYSKYLEFLPGCHSVFVHSPHRGLWQSSGGKALSFYVEAGKRYEVDIEKDERWFAPNRWDARIIDNHGREVPPCEPSAEFVPIGPMM